jgi:uncharacterized protein YjbI with pentapeptide repeats
MVAVEANRSLRGTYAALWAFAAGFFASWGAAFAGASWIAMIALGALVSLGVYLWLIDDRKSWGDLGQGLLVGIVVSLVILYVQHDADQRLRKITDRQQADIRKADRLRAMAASKQAVRMQLVAAGDLSGDSFRREDLSGFVFAGRDLDHLDFTEANLRGADLDAASLRGIAAAEAKFASAFLARADLRGSVLAGASFDGANLEHSDLRGVQASGADFTDAWLQGADLRHATLMSQPEFRGSFVSFRPPESLVADFAAPLARPSFEGAQLREAELSGHEEIDRVSFRGARMRGANLTESSLSNSDLRETDLAGANLSLVDLSGASLCGAELAGADLSGALYDDRTRWPGAVAPSAAQYVGFSGIPSTYPAC